MTSAKEIQRILRATSKNKVSAKKLDSLKRFFKTGKGEYGENDQFLGISMPELREHAKDYLHLTLEQITPLLESPYNEERMLGLIILVEQFKKLKATDPKDATHRQAIVDYYLAHTTYINNWNLVDVSCYFIVGEYLLSQEDRSVLYRLAESTSLWERRIAIVSTMAFLRKGQYSDTFAIADKLLNDDQDLIHKAVGWLVKEVGKRDQEALTNYLDRTATKMPRTMLRFSVEKLPAAKKNKYMKINAEALAALKEN